MVWLAGRAFGSYGFYNSIGHTLGPLLGGVQVWLGGFRLLFALMTSSGWPWLSEHCRPCLLYRRWRGPGRRWWTWPVA